MARAEQKLDEAESDRRTQARNAARALDSVAEACQASFQMPERYVGFSKIDEADGKAIFPQAEYCIDRDSSDTWRARLVLRVDSTDGKVKAFTYLRLGVQPQLDGCELTIGGENQTFRIGSLPPELEKRTLSQIVDIVGKHLASTIDWHRTGKGSPEKVIGFDVQVTDKSNP